MLVFALMYFTKSRGLKKNAHGQNEQTIQDLSYDYMMRFIGYDSIQTR